VSDYEIIERIDAFCDAAPRRRANAEQLGPLILFVPAGPGWPYYARPRRDLRTVVTVADVRRVRARQRELLIPESFEWIQEVTPGLETVAASAGLAVHSHPLLTLGTLVSPAAPPRATIRVVPPDDPDLVMAWAVPGVAFSWPGTEIGEAGVMERDKVAAGHDGSTIGLLRERLESRESVLVAAFGPAGPLAAGSYQLADGVAEITGVGVLPSSRQRGLGAGVTAALAADAIARGAHVVFLSATDDQVARIYARLGFRRIGTAMIADPPHA
jgi:ribosomal protein S18 acetylase RimI-like enzyme